MTLSHSPSQADEVELDSNVDLVVPPSASPPSSPPPSSAPTPPPPPSSDDSPPMASHLPPRKRAQDSLSSSSSSPFFSTPSVSPSPSQDRDLEAGPSLPYVDEKRTVVGGLRTLVLAPLPTPPASPPKTRRGSIDEKEVGEWRKEGEELQVHASGDLRSVVPIFVTSMTLGWLLVMSNKYILSVLQFPYPIFLTTSHMAFAVIGTRLLKAFAPRFAGMNSSSAESEPLSWPTYVRTVLPIGILFSSSLILSNSAVLLLSVSLVQMLKAFTPASILIISAVFRLRTLDSPTISVILVISIGCAVAAYGEMHFSLPGLLCQLGAVLSESLRLVMIQLLLQGQKMDPLTSLYHYAPVCLTLNLLLLPLFEGLSTPISLLLSPLSPISIPILLANATIAFALNVSTLMLIQRIGGLTLSLAGVGKDIGLIVGSVCVFGGRVGGVQVVGYALSLVGLFVYRFKTPQA